MPNRKILYKNQCSPQEQVSSGGKYYADSDTHGAMMASYTYNLGTGNIAAGTLTSSGELGGDTGFDFIAVENETGDDVTLSLDNGTTQIIKIKAGECFASKIASSAQPYVTISGTSTVKYITGVAS